MKSTVTLVMALFVSLIVTGSRYDIYQQQDDKKIIATYKGMTEDEEFQFADDKGKTVLFDEVSNEVEVDLYDDENIGEKFTVTWEEEVVELYDDEDEPTGETKTYKRITDLKQ
jgi:ligand-binding SRPBCC domain-containing protein